MRRASPVLVLVVLAAVVGVGVWIWKHEAPPTIGPATAASSGTTAADSATPEGAGEPSGPARVAESAPASERHGRFGARGIVLVARDGSPAAGARVLAYPKSPPLAHVSFRDEMRRNTTVRKAAAVQDLGQIGGPGDDSDEHDHAASDSGAKEKGPEDDASDRDNRPIADAVADASGRFELLGLEASSFHLQAQLPPSIAADSVHVEFAPDDAVTIRDGIELRLGPGAVVRGRVRTSAGEPVADAKVTLQVPINPYGVFSPEGFDLRAPATARSGRDGRFVFAAVPAPVDLKARASAEGYADSDVASLSVRPGGTSELELTLRLGASIVLHVVDDQGAPLAGADCRCEPTKLKLDQLGMDAESMQGPPKKSDESGAVRFASLQPGKWRVTAEMAGRLGASKLVELTGPDATAEAQLRIEAGREMRGTVKAKDGTPVAGAALVAYLEPSLGNIGSMSGRSGRQRAKSGEDGTFRLEGLPPDKKLLLDTNAAGYQKSSLKVEADGKPVDVVLATRGALEGIVVSRKTMQPVPRFDLKLARKKEFTSFFNAGEAGNLVDLTLPFATENGKFRVVGVNPGTMRFSIRAPGHGEATSEWLTLSEGETRKGLLVYLEAEAVVEGIVVDGATGAPISGAEVRREVGNQNPIENMMAGIFAGSDAQSDKEGRFRVDGLSAGPLRLVVTRAGFVDAAVPEFSLAAGQTITTLRVELEKGGEIYGRVSSPDGTPAPGATVFCQETTRMRMRSVKADDAGDYRLDGLAPGNYSVLRLPESFDLSGDNFMADFTGNMQAQSVRLKAGESVRIDLAGAPKGRARLEGKVHQAGKPVSGALVNVFAQETGGSAGTGGLRSTACGADGHYEIAGLVAGPAFVQVNLSDMGMDGGQSACVATVQLRDGETTELDLEVPSSRVVGLVVDAESGEPLAGVAVYAASAESTGATMLELAMRRGAAVHTDAHGAFELKNLRGGLHRIVAGGGDLFAGASATHALVSKEGVVVPDGGKVDVGTLRLPAAARIEGTVSDKSGKPLPGASLFLREPGGRYLEEWTGTSSNESGTFEYGGIPDGTWDLVCRAPGHATAVVRNVVAHTGETTSVRVTLIGGTEVFADIGTVDFEKLLDLSLEVEGPDGRIPLTLFGLGDLTDLLSRPWQPDVVRLGRFGPGEYRVKGTLGGKPFEKSFTLAGEPELHVPVSLP